MLQTKRRTNSSTISILSCLIKEFYKELKADKNGRFRSWEYSYKAFYNARREEKPNYDYLSLILSFYLASWGMYRGSSFLLQKDYRIHIPVIKEILKRKYDVLCGIKCIKYKREENLDLLFSLIES